MSQVKNRLVAIDYLLEHLERHPEALGYLPRLASARPDAQYYRNPLGYRGRLEDTIISEAGESDAEGLKKILYADIDLVVFDRYEELMESKRLEATVEQIFSERCRASKVGQVVFNCIHQYVRKGDEALFEEKLSIITAMGWKRCLKSPAHAAGIKPEGFYFDQREPKSENEVARYRHAVDLLLRAGMVNILEHQSTALNPMLFKDRSEWPEMERVKQGRLGLWQQYLKALVLGGDQQHQDASRLTLGGCGAIYITLQELVVNDDLAGVKRLAARYDLPGVYATLARDKPLSANAGRSLSPEHGHFRITGLLNKALPSARADENSRSFEMFDLLMQTGLAPYLSERREKTLFAAELGTDYEGNPELFDQIYDRANLREVEERLSDGHLVGRALKLEYVACSFYAKRFRESSNPDLTKKQMIKSLTRDQQVQIFSHDGLMKRYGLVPEDRMLSIADTVRSQVFSEDLGL